MQNTNTSILLQYGLCMFLEVVCVLLALRHREKKTVRFYIAMAGSTFLWLTFGFLSILAKTPKVSLVFNELRFIGVAFTPVMFYFVMCTFFPGNQDVTRRKVLLLCIVPAITSVLACTAPFHTLMRTELSVLQMEPVRVFGIENGPWFYINAVYGYVLLCMALVRAIRGSRRVAAPYRMSANIAVAASLIVVIANVAVVLFDSSSGIDYTAVGMALMSCVLYLTIINQFNVNFLSSARDEVFQGMNSALFILNLEDQVMDVNRRARRLIGDDAQEKEYLGRPVDELLKRISEKNSGDETDVKVKKTERSHDMHLYIQGKRVVYDVRKYDVYDTDKEIVGRFLRLTDVTQTRRMVSQAEERAGMDALTGLRNRRYFMTAIEQVDTQENLPISVIMGDANLLKYTNDKFGHAKGDELLQGIASCMLKVMPEGALVARIGGDEFAILLPRTTAQEVAEKVAVLEREIAAHQIGDKTLSVALGYETKSEAGQAIQEMMKVADERMYINKRNDRRGHHR